jgi:chemotaxis protein histidine kinase CheA
MASLSEPTKKTASSLTNKVSKVMDKIVGGRTTPVESEKSPAKLLGSIYELMVKMDEDRRLHEELQQTYDKEDALGDKHRHEELIKVLTGRKKKPEEKKSRQQRRAEERQEKKEEEKTKKRDPKQAEQQSKQETKKTEQKADQSSKKSEQKSDQETKKVEQKSTKDSDKAKEKAAEESKRAQQKAAEEAKKAEQKAAEEAKKAEQKAAEETKQAEQKVKKETAQVERPVTQPPKQPSAEPAITVKPPPKTTTITPGKTPTGGISTAVRVSKEAPYLYEATKNTEFMAGLGLLATKYNSTVPDLLSFMMNESELKPDAYNSNGGASGLIQIMPDTFKGMKERGYKSVKNIETLDDLRKLSIVEQLPIIDDYFNYSQFEKSAKISKEQGKTVDLATLYSAIFLPAFKDKPNDFIMGIRPGETVNGKKAEDIFYGKTTYGHVYLDNNAFDQGSKVTKKDAKNKPLEFEGGKGYFNKGDVGAKAGKHSKIVSQSLSLNESGQNLNSQAIENKDLKKSMDKPAIQTTTNTIVNAPSTTTIQPSVSKDDDRPAILIKR